MGERWWIRERRTHAAVVRLFCFPHAGGMALTYDAWASLIPSFVELCAIEYPGRGARWGEDPYRRLEPLVESLVDAMQGLLDRPFALFGHSMGALVAFEVAHRLRERLGVEPCLLCVSAHQAPQLYNTAKRKLHLLPDAELLDEVRRFNGTPEEVLANADLMELWLPVFRADMEAYENYRYKSRKPLNCAILAFGGQEDSVTVSELAMWRLQTLGPFAQFVFPGDHFYLTKDPSRSLVLQVLVRELYRLVTESQQRGNSL